MEELEAKQDKRRRKPTVLQGGNRVAVSEAEAAQIMGLKESGTFRDKFVPMFIQPSLYPDSKSRMYNVYEVLGLFNKTKETKERYPIVDNNFIARARNMAIKTTGRN